MAVADSVGQKTNKIQNQLDAYQYSNERSQPNLFTRSIQDSELKVYLQGDILDENNRRYTAVTHNKSGVLPSGRFTEFARHHPVTR